MNLLLTMARSSCAAAGALSRFGLGSNLSIQAMQGYSVVAAKVELSAGLIRPEPKQAADNKDAAAYRPRSWMPDPVTGYYIPEDHFGETDIAELRENILKDHAATSRGGPN